MLRASLKILVCAAAITACCAAAHCQTAGFRYKFTRGELLRYKLTAEAKLQLGVKPDGQFFEIPIKIDAVGKQATKSVSASGDGELVLSIGSLKLTLGNESFDAKPDKIQSITVVLTSLGAIKQVIDANITMNSILETQLYSQLNLAAFAVAFPVKAGVGESWSREVPFVGKGGSVKLTSRIVGPDKAAVEVRSAIDLSFPFAGRGDQGLTVRANGDATGGLEVQLDREIGKTRQVTGKGDLNLTVTATGLKGVNTTYVKLHGAKFEALLLDPKAQPPASE